MKNQIVKNWPPYAAIISAIMLGSAHAFETFGKLYPCALCLHQREVYWLALGVGFFGFIIRLFIKLKPIARTINALLAVIFTSGVIVAGFHVGVEQHWWLGLPECVGGGNFAPTTDLLEALSKPISRPSCDDIPWHFLGMSMAFWNMVVSIGLALFSGYCAIFGIISNSDLVDKNDKT